MDSFKDVLEAAQSYCKAQMAEPTYNLYIYGLEPISFEDSSHITLSVRNDFICKIVTDRYLGLLKEAFKTVLGFDVDITLVVPSTPPHEVVLAMVYFLRKNSSPVWGLFWSQNGDRLAIQQYIAHYGLLSSIFFAFLQTFLKNLCGEAFNFFTHFPWKTFHPQYLVASLRLGHKAVSQTQVCLFYVL